MGELAAATFKGVHRLYESVRIGVLFPFTIAES